MAVLDKLLAEHRVLICAGSGGVGKTTTAAAIALRAAQQGYRALVLTIDPAKRLADALGLRGMGREAVTVTVAPRGSLTALMLDQKGAWDALIERHAPSPEIRYRILQNRFYQHLSQSFAGSQEYMAIEQLCELYESGQYDRIVVDTPPTRHALDFLEAPQRIADFLDREVVRWFVRPYFSAGWSTLRFMNRTVNFLLRRLEQATGVSALVEISDFFTAMAGLFENFEPRVRRVYQLLRAPETIFVLVASPEEQVLQEAEFFFQQIDRLGVRLGAFVINRMHRELVLDGRPPSERALWSVLRKLQVEKRLGQELLENFLAYQALGRGDVLRVENFQRALPRPVPIVTVPNLPSDIHDLTGLASLHPFLFAGNGERSAGAAG
jgi:anion-transporting  ArsA/GET3 family ATPase